MDIEEIRQKKIQEMLSRQNNESQEEAILKKQISILENNIKRFMTKEAVSRYMNIKFAHNDLAVQLLLVLNQGIEQGKLKVIDDIQLKALLLRMQQGNTDFTITRK